MTAVMAPRSFAHDVAGPPAVTDRRSLANHACVLFVLHLLAGAVVGFDGMVSADEGAVLGQAAVRNRTGTYGMRYWAESWDPAGRWFPVHLAERHGDRWFLFTKKPAYVELVAWVGRLLPGGFAVRALHVAAVVAAALAAALVARRVRPGAERWVLWATGLASPLAMDGHWVIAHAPAAAACGVAAVGVACWWAEGRRRGLVMVVVGLVSGILLRHEVVLLGLAVGTAAVVPTRGGGAGRRRFALCVGAIGATALGVVAGAVWQRAVEGGSDAGLYRVKDQVGWLAARGQALWNTFLSPGTADASASSWLVAAAAAAVVIGWSAPVRARARWTFALTTVAAGLLGIRLVVGGSLVPGVLAAWPVGVAALAVGWGQWARLGGPDLGALLARIGLLFGLAVLATTYASGGTGDWGGRYVHVALPFVVPVVVAVLSGSLVERAALRPAVAALAVASLLVWGIGVAGFRRAATNSATLAEITSWVNEPTNLICTSGSVIVTTSPVLGRFAWGEALEHPMLFVDPSADVEASARDLAAAFPGRRFAVIAPRADVAAIRRGLTPRRMLPSVGDGRGSDRAPAWVYPGRCHRPGDPPAGI